MKIQEGGEKDGDTERQRFGVRDVNPQTEAHRGVRSREQRQEGAAEGPASQGRLQARGLGADTDTEKKGQRHWETARGIRRRDRDTQRIQRRRGVTLVLRSQAQRPLWPRSCARVGISARVFTHTCPGV